MAKKVKKSKKGSSKLSIFIRVFALILMIGGIATIWVGTVWVRSVIADAPRLDVESIYAENSTFIYDRHGELVTELGVQRREWVRFNDISPVMIDAILATEDSRFFEHPGVDWFRTIGAGLFTAEVMITGSNANIQGGSTITQQLMKQSHLDDAQTFERKIQEIYLSMNIERVLSKEQIIEAYLNFSPFGGNVHGIQAAAQFYFGKSASELTLSEAATLAGLVQAPNVWRPDWRADNTQIRRNTVLDLMVLHGYITPELRDLAAAEPITDKLVYDEAATTETAVAYQSFIDAVLDEVHERFELDAFSGLRIYTTMDREAQRFVHDIQNTNNHIVWPNEDLQSGIVFMETQTGHVRAIGGGSNTGAREFNLATQLQRQPGSTSKPIFAYGAAFEYLGWGTGTMINDELYGYRDTGMIINNWDRRLRGRTTIREAMDMSYNVAAVKSFNAVVDAQGPEAKAGFISRLGFEVYADRPSNEGGIHESMAIGGVATGFSPLQMAGAYAAFGNGGVFNEPITIERIETSDGEIIYETAHSERAMSEETAYMMTDLLRTVMTQGTGTRANAPGMFLAGKTGTTDFPAEIMQQFNMPATAMRDSWFVGYSTQYTAAIWTGYTDTSRGQFLTQTTQAVPWDIFRTLMANLNTAGWELPVRPATVVPMAIELQSGNVDGEVFAPSGNTPGTFTRTELFVSGRGGPGQVSTQFTRPDTPTNFTASVSGTTLTFNWNHIGNRTLNRSEAQAAFNRAYGARQGHTHMTEALRSLSPTEAEAQMMLNRIDSTGPTVYTVYARLANGNNVPLGNISENRLTIDVSFAELASFESFHVLARFENSRGVTSEASNVVSNTAFDENYTSEINIPNMVGWNIEEAREWANQNDVELETRFAASDDIEQGLIISTNPSTTIESGQTLTIIVSAGSGPGTPEVPDVPEVPDENPDDMLDEPIEEIINLESSSWLPIVPLDYLNVDETRLSDTQNGIFRFSFRNFFHQIFNL